jgi:hypothetical protein
MAAWPTKSTRTPAPNEAIIEAPPESSGSTAMAVGP